MRKIYNEDAIVWMNNYIDSGDNSFVASMPDFSEFPELEIEEWKEWFINTAKLIIEKTSLDGVSIFYQSDIKFQGQWIDKSYLVQKAAEECNSHLLWHKIICRVPGGMITFGRPSYSHIVCFSKKLKLDNSKSTADIISHVGEKTWERGMGVNACTMIAKFILQETSSKILINPFCGLGSMVSVAEAYGLNTIGIEKSLKRSRESEKLIFDVENKNWK